MHKLSVVLPERFLRGGCGARVGSLVEASRGDFRGEPIGLGQTQYERDECVLNLLLR